MRLGDVLKGFCTQFLLVSIKLGGNIHDFVRQESHEYIAALNCLLSHVEQSGCQSDFGLCAGALLVANESR